MKKKKKDVKQIQKTLNNQRYRNTNQHQKNKNNSKKNKGILLPKTTNEVMQCFFKEFDQETNLFKIKENCYSICFEYNDISFAKADSEQALKILCKWRDYLNTLSESIHVQIVNANTPIMTKDFKEKYRIHYDFNLSDNEQKIGKELNTQINRTIGNKEITLVTKKYLVLTVQADNYLEASKLLLDLEHTAQQKFKEMESSLRVCSCEERLEFLYDIINLNTHELDGIENIIDSTNTLTDSTGLSYNVYDTLAPKYFNLKEDDLIEIHENNELGSAQKFIRILYVAGLPTTLTPRFYNRISNIEDVNSIVTLNIQPVNNAKFVKQLKNQITSMKSERLSKIKKANKNGYSYEAVRDENLEDKLEKAMQLREDLLKNNQKIFENNMMIALIASSYDELTKATFKILEISGEQLIDIKPVKWQQLEGLMNVLPFGHNNIQFQRSLTSEATAINVPFNSKDILHESGLFFGTNLVSKRGIWADRTQLLNGNGCVLATSGAGKSFNIKLQIEQILLKYPNDEVIVIDPQGEYKPLIDVFKGQSIKISTNAGTYINPFDTDLNYGFSEDGSADPVKEKTEYIIAFCESLMGNGSLNGIHKTIIDRCVRKIFEEFELSQFKDKSLAPNLPKFYDELMQQPESDAKNLALTLERFVSGGMNIFAHDTNVDIKNRFVCFDIAELPSSMQTTGYLVVLDHIMNRLAHNKSLGKNTWLFIDEFHILLSNQYSAEYIAKIYKVGRKFNAMNTIVTQNIADVLNNEQGRKILSNSEFAVILKQKPLDLPNIMELFGISNELATYVQDPPAGQGILVYSNDKLPFYFPVPKKSYIYDLNNTQNMQIWN